MHFASISVFLFNRETSLFCSYPLDKLQLSYLSVYLSIWQKNPSWTDFRKSLQNLWKLMLLYYRMFWSGIFTTSYCQASTKKIIITVSYTIGFNTRLCKQKYCWQSSGGCPCGVMVKAMDWNGIVIALLYSLSGKYPWERYEPLYPHSYWLNSTTTVLLWEWLWH